MDNILDFADPQAEYERVLVEVTALRSENDTLRLQLGTIRRDLNIIVTRIRAMLKV
jgi:hypothetical protein